MVKTLPGGAVAASPGQPSVRLGPRLMSAQPGLHCPQDDASDDAHQNQVAKHLDHDHDPSRLGDGHDVAEPHRGEGRDREVQGVRAVQRPGEELGLPWAVAK